MTSLETEVLGWERYAAGTEVDYFAEFCERYLVHSEDRWAGTPVVLEDFQMRLYGEALAVDEAENPVWDKIVICIPRKNGKTAMQAALAVYRLVTSEGNPEILLAASSEKQASKLFKFAANYVRQSPELSKLCRVRDHEGEIARNDGLGVIMRMASDPRRLHGFGPTLVVCDEIGQWTTPQLESAFDALTSGSGARSAPQIFSITTPGKAHERHSSVLGEILDSAFRSEDVEHEAGLHIARQWDAKTLVYNYEAPTEDPSDIAAVKLANPAPWITEEFLSTQAASMRRSAFLQLHAGVWAEREDAWLPYGAWDHLADPEREVADESRIVAGFDGSDRNDSTALVGCTIGENPHLFVLGVWEKPEEDENWRVPRLEVEARIEEAIERFAVLELACDPPGWRREIEEWGERFGSVVALQFPTNRRQIMVEACSKFYAAVMNGELSHDGNPALARHLANAVVKETPDGIYITKDHPNSKLKIDLAVAAVIAYARSQQVTGRDYLPDVGAMLDELANEPEEEDWL